MHLKEGWRVWELPIFSQQLTARILDLRPGRIDGGYSTM